MLHFVPETSARVRIALLGNKCVGKTSLLARLMTGTFHERSSDTVIDSSLVTILVDDRLQQVEIIDTGGEELYDSMRVGIYPTCHAFLVVVGRDDVNSWIDAGKYVTSIRDYATHASFSDFTLAVIAANKSDLPEAALHVFHNHVSACVGANSSVVSEHYHMVSARLGTGIAELFEDVVRLALINRMRMMTKLVATQLITEPRSARSASSSENPKFNIVSSVVRSRSSSTLCQSVLLPDAAPLLQQPQLPAFDSYHTRVEKKRSFLSSSAPSLDSQQQLFVKSPASGSAISSKDGVAYKNRILQNEETQYTQRKQRCSIQ